MNFATRSLLTLTKQQEGILGSEMYVTSEGLAAYSRITRDKDYYLAEADKRNWHQCADEIASCVPVGTPTLEYGTGDFRTAGKTANVVKSLSSAEYTGADKSAISIQQALETVRRANIGIKTTAICGDFWDPTFPRSTSPTLALLSGCSIGNFEAPEMVIPPDELLVEALSTLAERTNSGWVLLSVDILSDEYDATYYEKAYRSEHHALFNLSIFHRMKRELDGRLDPTLFAYMPIFNNLSGAVQHTAVATESQFIVLNGRKVPIDKGKSFLLQNSFKFSAENLMTCTERAGLTVERVWSRPDTTPRLYLCRAVPYAREVRACEDDERAPLAHLRKSSSHDVTRYSSSAGPALP